MYSSEIPNIVCSVQFRHSLVCTPFESVTGGSRPRGYFRNECCIGGECNGSAVCQSFHCKHLFPVFAMTPETYFRFKNPVLPWHRKIFPLSTRLKRAQVPLFKSSTWRHDPTGIRTHRIHCELTVRFAALLARAQPTVPTFIVEFGRTDWLVGYKIAASRIFLSSLQSPGILCTCLGNL